MVKNKGRLPTIASHERHHLVVFFYILRNTDLSDLSDFDNSKHCPSLNFKDLAMKKNFLLFSQTFNLPLDDACNIFLRFFCLLATVIVVITPHDTEERKPERDFYYFLIRKIFHIKQTEK